MSVAVAEHGIGAQLAARLGLTIIGREGHDLKGACIACKSSDAFRVHSDTGVAYCYSCQAKWSPQQLIQQLAGEGAVKEVMIEVGLWEHDATRNGRAARNGAQAPDPVELIARQKSMPVDSYRVYGAKAATRSKAILPTYDETGTRRSSFTMTTRAGDKGKNAKGPKAGVFLPHDADGKPILPKPGETWPIVEGVKDAAALHSLGLSAIGLPGASMHSKFARLLRDVDVIIVPDRDGAGENGARKTAAVLHGVARSVRIATLPAEYKEKHGDDVRDILRRDDGEAQLRRAIEDAKPFEPDAETTVAALGGDAEEGLTKRLADAICEKDYFAQDPGGALCVYRKGVYRPKGEARIKAQAKRFCIGWGESAKWSPRLAEAVIEWIRIDAPLIWDRPPLDVLNVKNGLLRVADRQLLPHSPDYLSLVQLPVEFDPEARCPAIETFVSEVFPEDATELAFEVVAWLMLPTMSLQVAVLLVGEGSNGKSTYLTMLVEFMGRENVAGIALQKLEADRFSVARLIGKLANVCADLPSEHLAGTSVFKALTGGDVLIPAERKFCESFEFTPYCRLIFSANHPPRSNDGSHAFFRRWVVVPFGRTFEGREIIPREVLDARLASPAELSGLLNRAVDCLPGIRSRNAFTESDSMREAWAEFYATTDPLAVWLNTNTIEDPNAVVSASDLRDAYNRDASASGRPSLNKTAFGRAIKRLKKDLETAQRTVAGKLQWVYLGLGIRAEDTSRTSRSSRSSLPFGSPSTHARKTGGEWGADEQFAEDDNQKGKNSVNSVNSVNADEGWV